MDGHLLQNRDRTMPALQLFWQVLRGSVCNHSTSQEVSRDHRPWLCSVPQMHLCHLCALAHRLPHSTELKSRKHLETPKAEEIKRNLSLLHLLFGCFFKMYLFLFFLCVCLVYMYVCGPCMPSFYSGYWLPYSWN